VRLLRILAKRGNLSKDELHKKTGVLE